jgi:hypothetical protein
MKCFTTYLRHPFDLISTVFVENFTFLTEIRANGTDSYVMPQKSSSG